MIIVYNEFIVLKLKKSHIPQKGVIIIEKICFETKLYEINTWQILKFPKQSSDKLPSRGMVMVKGTLNNIDIETPLEPDGMGSHWFRVSDTLLKEAHVNIGDMVTLIVEPMKIWPEPEVPSDLNNSLVHSDLLNQWNKITTKARWEWIRWIRFTSNDATRQKRIKTACSMLSAGKKRPCCFDQSRCTITSVSKNGVLLPLTEI